MENTSSWDKGTTMSFAFGKHKLAEWIHIFWVLILNNNCSLATEESPKLRCKNLTHQIIEWWENSMRAQMFQKWHAYCIGNETCWNGFPKSLRIGRLMSRVKWIQKTVGVFPSMKLVVYNIPTINGMGAFFAAALKRTRSTCNWGGSNSSLC